MKERPILFSGPMVRSILEDRKTQTRRVVNPQPNAGWKFNCFDSLYYWWTPDGTCNLNGPHEGRKCPFGQPGDRLWVKETFRIFNSNEECACYDDCKCALFNGKPIYKADGNLESKWKPSIHMPRWASRITLEIDAVRVERLQDISEEDAKAEGAEFGIYCGPDDEGPALRSIDCESDERLASHRDGFRFLWECINGPGSWDANPWVWVIQFRRIQP